MKGSLSPCSKLLLVVSDQQTTEFALGDHILHSKNLHAKKRSHWAAPSPTLLHKWGHVSEEEHDSPATRGVTCFALPILFLSGFLLYCKHDVSKCKPSYSATCPLFAWMSNGQGRKCGQKEVRGERGSREAIRGASGERMGVRHLLYHWILQFSPSHQIPRSQFPILQGEKFIVAAQCVCLVTLGLPQSDTHVKKWQEKK